MGGGERKVRNETGAHVGYQAARRYQLSELSDLERLLVVHGTQ